MFEKLKESFSKKFFKQTEFTVRTQAFRTRYCSCGYVSTPRYTEFHGFVSRFEKKCPKCSKELDIGHFEFIMTTVKRYFMGILYYEAYHWNDNYRSRPFSTRKGNKELKYQHLPKVYL